MPAPSIPQSKTGRISSQEDGIATVSSHGQAPRFNIIDESEDYIVVDKPAFLLTHPTKPDQRITLWKQLGELLAFEIANGGQVSIVNRLDRETSGLVLVAKTAAAARRFGLLMQQQQFHKEYVAIVWGWPEWETHIIDSPLDRQGKYQASAIWLKQMIHPKGAKAITEFKVEHRFERSARPSTEPSPQSSPSGRSGERDSTRTLFTSPSRRGGDASPARTEAPGEGKFSLVRAIPKTGRTHQIRVHLASTGHPIVGDKIYGPNENLYLEFIETGWTEKLQRALLLPRHALHSANLSIDNEYRWTAALPDDLAEFVGDSL